MKVFHLFNCYDIWDEQSSAKITSGFWRVCPYNKYSFLASTSKKQFFGNFRNHQNRMFGDPKSPDTSLGKLHVGCVWDRSTNISVASADRYDSKQAPEYPQSVPKIFSTTFFRDSKSGLPFTKALFFEVIHASLHQNWNITTSGPLWPKWFLDDFWRWNKVR